jgi:sortase B
MRTESITALFLACCLLNCTCLQEYKMMYHSKTILQEAEKVIQNTDSSDRDRWKILKDINRDFIGYLEFESGLISLPIVKGDNNSFYLNHGFDGSINHMGCPFIDYEDTEESQGAVIYGHNVEMDTDAMFSPLIQLSEQKTYEENKIFHILFEKETREYRIASVIRVGIHQQHLDQRKSSFADAHEFNEWIAEWKKGSLIQSNESLSPDHRFAILQTCITGSPSERLLILAVQR